MVSRQKINPYRKWRDPAALTPYEMRILTYLEQGMPLRQITLALGGARSVESVRSTIKTIKEKLESSRFDDESSVGSKY
jgi:DNA-binding CsgD family transcriptional regulator